MDQLESKLDSPLPDYVQVLQLKRSLEEKIDTLKTLDAEIIELITDEGELASDVEQADAFKGPIYAAFIKAKKLTPDTSSSGGAGPTRDKRAIA